MPTNNCRHDCDDFQRGWLRGARRGSLYLSVLGVAMIVSAVGMSALVVARVNLRSVSWRQERREARILADAAIELGLGNLMQNTAWRTSFLDSQENPPTPLAIGNGTVAWKLVDEDGNLADDYTDRVRLWGIGRVGQAVYTKSVLLESAGAGLTCLEASLHSGGQLWMWSGVTIATDGLASTNNSIYRNGSGIIAGDAAAVGSIQSGSVSGTATTGITPRQMPDSTAVFEYYLNNGTWIDFADLPSAKIENVVLSPGRNPYGAGITNREGIYVIDCQGNNVDILNARLHATLVLLNVGSGAKIVGNVHWEPAAANFPALLVDGNMLFQWNGGSPLSEASAGVNFNPPGSPYYAVEDSDQIDSYPGVIKGLVYISGYSDIQDVCTIEGVLVTGSINPNANMNLTYNPVFLANPPPGFRGTSVVDSAEQQWLDQNTSNSGSGNNYTLGGTLGVGAYFTPTLPADAMSWSITRVQIYTNDGGSAGTFDASVTRADGAMKPAAVLQSINVSETSLPGSFDWHEITFASATGLQPTESACVTFVSAVNAGARIKCGVGSTASPGTHRLTTIDGGTNWNVEPSDDMWIKIWGTYTTADGSVVEISPGSWQREVSE